MAQVTVYIRDDLVNRAKSRARQEKESLSGWLGHIIERELAENWPVEFVQLAGSMPGFLEQEEIRPGAGKDARREAL